MQETAGSSPALRTVAVPEMDNGADCGSVLYGFKSRRSPIDLWCNWQHDSLQNCLFRFESGQVWSADISLKVRHPFGRRRVIA